MSADQFDPAQEQGFPSNEYPSNVDTSSPYSGNRPASGARRATPGEVLSQGFQGAENAGDFLGLDVEFTGSQGQGLEGGLDLVPPPGTYAPSEGEYEAPVPAPLPEGDAAQEFAQAPSAFEFGEDLGSEESAGEAAFAGTEFEGSASKKTPLLVGGLLLAGLAGAGYFFGPGLYSKYFGKATPLVAESGGPAAKTDKPTRTTPAKGEIAALPAEGAPAGITKTPVGESAGSTPTTETPRVEPSSGAREGLPAGRPQAEPVAEAQPTLDEPVVVASTAPARTPAGSFPNLGGAEFKWASSEETEMIWRGSELPLEAVRAPVRTMTPRVGEVRVFTTAGENFDGRLYAVGQNRVWLDSGAGRIGLDGALVERIEVLPPAPAGQTKSGDSAPIAGGRHVRARVPGGVLYGRILRSSGEDVTIVLDDGGKVQVKAGDLEDLGSGRAVVVSR